MRLVAAIVAAACLALPASASELRRILAFEDLIGWSADDHDRALKVFARTCGDMKEAEWLAICNVARSATDARAFFEIFFRPVLIENGEPSLITGYYEPELKGSRIKSARYRVPVYRTPPGHVEGVQWHDRRTIETGNVMPPSSVIAWTDDPVGLFYLQLQGSGRIRLAEGGVIRLGFAGSNGHRYRSPGQELVRRGVYSEHQVSQSVIRNWYLRNPIEGAELLRGSDSYVFFRVIGGMDAETGPRGAMNRSVTAGRSLAVDPSYVPLGAPVWMEKAGRERMNRLMVAQDTGSAIKGPQRADLFVGSGEVAGKRAAQMKDRGRLVVLLPIETAYNLAAEF